MVEIARAFMLEPVLLLMDEPSTGLDPKARHSVFETIAGINNDGTTVLLVEQNARSALAIAHHGVVMDAGVIRLRGPGTRLLEDPEVARLYLGSRTAVVG
jgi:ABC-type branched-subunit amino acid transport system ATPase component